MVILASMNIVLCVLLVRQTERQRDRETERQRDRETERETERDRETDRLACRQPHR